MLLKHRNFWGIDPGKNGGWAFFDSETGRIEVGRMPLTGGQVDVDPLAKIINTQEKVIVAIEKVHAMPGQGVSSMFSFGLSYGKIIGLCQSMGVSFDLVLPTRWKKEVLAGTTKDKEAAIEYVSRMYRSVSLIPERCRKAHSGIADAVCIMEWGIRKYGSKENTCKGERNTH